LAFISVDGATEDPGGSEGSARGGWAFLFQRDAEGDPDGVLIATYEPKRA